MKKLLAICSIFFSVCATFTGCGSEDTPYDSNNDSVVSSDEKNGRDDDRKSDSVGDHVDDAIDGVGDAGDDIIKGATDAADDIVDGLDGEKDHDKDDKKDKDDKDSKTTTTTRKR
jgi:histone chaperone ASF1